MGDLITMSRSKAAVASDFANGHSADILFFTGVRYYRMDEAVEAPAKASESALVLRRRSPQQRRAAKRPRTERERKALA